MIRRLSALAMALVSATTALAQTSAPIDMLFDALGLPAVVAIMREEGIKYGSDLDIELFAGHGGAHWGGIVAEIYDQRGMELAVRKGLDSELAAADLAPMIGFFSSERGQRIVGLEVSARRALLDASVDEASRAVLDEMILNRNPRLELIRDFVDVNQLVDNNVAGAMNSNYAFYRGLVESGEYSGAITEEQILADVWSQEEAIRDDTREWLYSYLIMAYRPLDDAELQDYIDFSRTEAGATVNRALFAAFDAMYAGVSLALGRAASELLSGEEL